jgi:hypothetical protein
MVVYTALFTVDAKTQEWFKNKKELPLSLGSSFVY